MWLRPSRPTSAPGSSAPSETTAQRPEGSGAWSRPGKVRRQRSDRRGAERGVDPDSDSEASMTWRELRAIATHELAGAGIGTSATEARFIVERASGYDAGEWLEIADATAPARAEQELREMVRRRVAGEPLQYVLGGWAFRGLDLFVDHRVLIPRPETEYVVEVALEEAARSGLRRSGRGVAPVEPEPYATVAGIGTGSGAISIARATEL